MKQRTRPPRPSVPRTLEQFRLELARRLDSASRRHFRTPNHDWPVLALFVQSQTGIEWVDIAELVSRGLGGKFKTAGEKDLARDVIRTTIAAAGAYRYAVVMNGHKHEPVDQEDARRVEVYGKQGGRLEQLPGSYELLTMTLGDAETEQVWQARIHRDLRQLRRLGPWRRDPDISFTGRFVDVGDLLREPR